MHGEGLLIELTSRQLEILDLVKSHAPITGDQIADHLGISKPTIRSDLSVLVMLNYLDAKPKVGYFPGTALSDRGLLFQKVLDMKVKDVQGQPVTVRENATVNDAVITLFLENVGSLIVADEAGILKGMVSRKDLLKVTLGNAEAPKMPISFVMTRSPNVVTVYEHDPVVEAARKMIRHQVDSLPVVREVELEGSPKPALEVVGRISKTSMTQVLLDETTNLG